MEPQDLCAAITSAQAGQADGYQALLDEYSQRLFGYFVRAVGNRHDAEDLLSELTLKLVKNLKKYDHRNRFEPWLFRIAANMVRDYIRRRKSNPVVASLSAVGLGNDDSSSSPEERFPSPPQDVDAGLIAAESSQRVQSALNELDEKARQMVLLRYFGQMSFKELAEMFDCPTGTVLARVHRALKALRKIMDKP